MDFSFDHKKENTPMPVVSNDEFTEEYIENPNEQQDPEFFQFLNSKILIFGKRGSGKTTLIKDIYRKLQNEIDEVHVFNQPKSQTSDYADITDAIYDDFSLLEDFPEHCQKNPNSKKLLILENHCNIKQLSVIEDIIFNGLNVTLIIVCQYPMGMKPEYRVQFDYVFTAYDDSYSNKQRLYNYYFGMFPSLAMFCQILDSLKKYQFVCSKNTEPTSVTVYKPEVPTLYKFIQTNLVQKGISQTNKKILLMKQVNETIESLIKMRDLLNDLL